MNNSNVSMEDQQKMYTFLNDLIEKSNDSLTCGPDCQRERKLQDLKQNYLDAQLNEQTAPHKYQEAKKKYIIFKEGEGNYNKLRLEELEKKAEKIIGEIESKFKEQIVLILKSNQYLETEIINSKNTIELLEDYKVKDELLVLERKNKINEVMTNDRKSYYENQEIDSIKRWSVILLWIYFIAVIVLSLEVLFSSTLKIPIKFIILVCFYFYPFIIFSITGILYKFLENTKKTFYSLFPQNAYINI